MPFLSFSIYFKITIHVVSLLLFMQPIIMLQGDIPPTLLPYHILGVIMVWDLFMSEQLIFGTMLWMVKYVLILIPCILASSRLICSLNECWVYTLASYLYILYSVNIFYVCTFKQFIWLCIYMLQDLKEKQCSCTDGATLFKKSSINIDNFEITYIVCSISTCGVDPP